MCVRAYTYQYLFFSTEMKGFALSSLFSFLLFFFFSFFVGFVLGSYLNVQKQLGLKNVTGLLFTTEEKTRMEAGRLLLYLAQYPSLYATALSIYPTACVAPPPFALLTGLLRCDIM
jgi:hypothetical protein